jgi:hypothetical protein
LKIFGGYGVNLKKLIVFEIVAVIVAVALITVFVGITPYLGSSGQNGQIGVFNQREYIQKTAAIQPGQIASSRFNYTTFDPAILVVELRFENWQKPGKLSMYCNGILIDTFDATPNNPYVKSTTVTFSGFDLVKPPASRLGITYQFAYGNEISFLSPIENGYAGTFNYQISIRGSR